MEREACCPRLTKGSDGTACAVCVQGVACETSGVHRRSKSPRTGLPKAQPWPRASFANQPCNILFTVDLQISSLKTEPTKEDVGLALEFVTVIE